MPVGGRGGADVVVFQFTGGLPGFTVEYVEPPILSDPAGQTIEVDGNAFLKVRFQPAVGHNLNTGKDTTLTELSWDLAGIVAEVKRIGDFEGVLTWVLGLDEEADFRVITLEDPFAVAVEVARP